jgi:hypothetical protein
VGEEESMASLLRIVLAAVAASLVLAGGAQARGGHYVFDGGTTAEQTQVKKALDVSAFDWNVVPATVTVHIAPGHASEALRGEIWLDADLLDAGNFSWGVVQHEYAHQVDFFLLDDARHAKLAALGGKAWWASDGQTASAPNGTLAHADLTSERFASTLAWAYWPSTANSMRPTSKSDESAAMAPAAFRTLLSTVLAQG